jgi:hypothetical protein
VETSSRNTRAQLGSSPFERRVARANATNRAEPPAQIRLIVFWFQSAKPLFEQKPAHKESD